ncbi:MAG: HEAT repeat domain-containing protein [Pseudomonadota bacterium]|nr:HEAT repeat domain-containing protein [Pseudomonadota bacterium]
MRPRYADLFRRMRDPDPVAADAAFDAVLFDRAGALPDLIECFQKSRKDPLLRFLCVQLLGFSESPDALPVLLDALDDKHEMVRAEACRSLEDLAHPSAISHLEARLDDIDEEVRVAAAEALLAVRGGGREAG